MNVTKEVALNGGGLKFTRVMGGEYFAETASGRYTIDYVATGCEDCGHGHEYWLLGFYETRKRCADVETRHRTLTDARIAATEHFLAANI